jgi:integrase
MAAESIVWNEMIGQIMTHATTETPLLTYLNEFYVLEKALAVGTEYLMSVSVRDFSAWLKREAIVGDLTEVTVSRWIRDLEQAGKLAAKTISGRRGDVMAIWRHAADDNLVNEPKRVRNVKVPRPMPVAWTMDEFDKILEACRTLTGYLKNGLPRARYFWALLKAGYETGLRRNDLLRLRLAPFTPDGVVVVVQHKTNRAHAAAVRPDTLEAIKELGKILRQHGEPNADCPLRWPYTPRQLYYWIDRITELAGVRHGALQQCRRTGATHTERVAPGSAVRYLGHASVSQAQSHYIDASQAYGVVIPPTVGDAIRTG